MSRKVYISSDISEDEDIDDVGSEDALAALLWPWLLTSFDDWGRSEASPKRLKNRVFPANPIVTAEVIEKALGLFAKYGLITLYVVEGKQYMAIDQEKWFKYQTHIRREKRDKDGSKFPAPDDNCAQQRASARDVAESSAIADDCIPSPSLSPSPSFTTTETEVEPTKTIVDPLFDFDDDAESLDYKTISQVHTQVFGTLVISPLFQNYYSSLLKRGSTNEYVTELLLEVGGYAAKPSLEYMQKVDQSWQEQGIFTREEARKRSEERKGTGGNGLEGTQRGNKGVRSGSDPPKSGGVQGDSVGWLPSKYNNST